jgi:hypothetical protein
VTVSSVSLLARFFVASSHVSPEVVLEMASDIDKWIAGTVVGYKGTDDSPIFSGSYMCAQWRLRLRKESVKANELIKSTCGSDAVKVKVRLPF